MSNKPTPHNDNAAPCPMCAGPCQQEYAPFCSRRCADLDLHRWLSGSYAIPAVDDDSEGAGVSGIERGD